MRISITKDELMKNEFSEEVREMRPTQATAIRGRHSGVPGFFGFGCAQASAEGSLGYSEPAYHLTMHLDRQMPDDIDMDEWPDVVGELRDSLANDDADGIYGWFVDHFPKAMSLVPADRKGEFVEGVIRADQEGRIEVQVQENRGRHSRPSALVPSLVTQPRRAEPTPAGGGQHLPLRWLKNQDPTLARRFCSQADPAG